jgi:hypothetical protein
MRVRCKSHACCVVARLALLSSLADSIEWAQASRTMIDGVGSPCIMLLEIGTVAVVCGCCAAHVLDLNSTLLMFRTLCTEQCQLLALLARWLSRHWPLGTCVHMCNPVVYTTLHLMRTAAVVAIFCKLPCCGIMQGSPCNLMLRGHCLIECLLSTCGSLVTREGVVLAGRSFCWHVWATIVAGCKPKCFCRPVECTWLAMIDMLHGSFW